MKCNKVSIFNIRFMSLKDIVNHIKWIKMGLCIAVYDPWFKNEVESKLNERKIEYVETYNPTDGLYEFAIIGGDKKIVHEFVDWFKADKNWKYAFKKDGLFGKDIATLIR